MWKKIVCYMLSLALVFTLTGCGEKKEKKPISKSKAAFVATVLKLRQCASGVKLINTL